MEQANAANRWGAKVLTRSGLGDLPKEHFDVQAPLMSLPLILGQVEPFAASYISAGNANSQPQRVKVGLVWGAKASNRRLAHRSVPLKMLSPLAQSNAEFYSLQIGEARSELATAPTDLRLTDLADRVTDFADTAALIAQLDLVISVDTAVAHLAGAMGKPTWLLLSFVADFRWQTERADSPWYPSMRLFRQKQIADWSEPVARMAEELRRLHG